MLPVVSSEPLQGLVLAAGLGKRLRPLTEQVPKPMLPFGGIPLLYLALAKMQDAGIERRAINTHHLPESIRDGLRGNPLGQGVQISHEPVLMDTGGVFVGLDTWAGTSDVLIHNGDIATDVDLAWVLRGHRAGLAQGSVATMVLLPGVVPGTNPVWSRSGQLVGIGTGRSGQATPDAATPHTFTGIHIVSRALRDFLPRSGPSSILLAYNKALESGMRVQTLVHEGAWFDLGTPESYLDAHFALLDSLGRNSFETLAKFGISSAAKALKRDVWFCPQNEQKNVGDLEICGPALITGPGTPSGRGRLGPRVCLSEAPVFDSQNVRDCVIHGNMSRNISPAATLQHTISHRDLFLKI